MLVLDRLTVRYGDQPAVDEVSLALEAGHVLAVLGPSGCGKSSLLRAIAGLGPVPSGSIGFDGVDLTRVPTHLRGFSLMFQDGQLFPHLSVGGNVGYALRLRRTPRRERQERVLELLALVGLAGYEARATGTLSGGERQRVALARALAVRPRLLLLDEPLSALDRDLRERLAHDLRDILLAEGTTAVFVTHDQEEAFTVADRLAVMWDGRLVSEGTLDDVWRHPVDAATARFLGYATVLEGAAAALVLEAGDAVLAGDGAVALRRSALRVSDDGRLCGVVRSARVTPEQSRLVVDVEGIGELDAVAGLDRAVRSGELVHLRLDASRAARLG